MVTIRAMVPGEWFLEVEFEGTTQKGFPNLEEFGRAIFHSCQTHNCNKVLLNFREIDYDLNTDIFAEHELAMSLSLGTARTILWAIILPKTFSPDAVQLVNAMFNPGVRFMAFLDRDTAIAWLESISLPSKT